MIHLESSGHVEIWWKLMQKKMLYMLGVCCLWRVAMAFGHLRVSPPILLPAPSAGRSPTSRRGEASRRGGAPWRRGNSGSRSSSSRSSKGWRGANWTWPCCSVSCSLQMSNTLTLFNIMLSPNIHMSQQLQDWTKLQTSKMDHINTLIHRIWPTSVMPHKHIWLRPWHFVMEGLTASCSKVVQSPLIPPPVTESIPIPKTRVHVQFGENSDWPIECLTGFFWKQFQNEAVMWGFRPLYCFLHRLQAEVRQAEEERLLEEEGLREEGETQEAEARAQEAPRAEEVQTGLGHVAV